MLEARAPLFEGEVEDLADDNPGKILFPKRWAIRGASRSG